MDKKWRGVDLDGTLAVWDGWKGVNHIGKPIPAMVKRVKKWLEDGVRVKIVTARYHAEFGDRAATVRAIKLWCFTHLGQELEVTNEKDGDMTELWDDRAVQVIKNKGITIQEDLQKRLKRAAKLAKVSTRMAKQYIVNSMAARAGK